LSFSGSMHEPAQQVSSEAGSLIRQSIDGSMRDILGEEARKATMFHLKVPDYERHPGEFHVHIGAIFMQGASVIEKVIVRDVYDKLDLRFDEDGKIDYVNSMTLALKEASKRQAEMKGEPGTHGKR